MTVVERGSARRAGSKSAPRSVRPEGRKMRTPQRLVFKAATPSRCVASRAGAAYEIVTVRRNHYSARIHGPDLVSMSREFRLLRAAKMWLEAHAVARRGEGEER